jgi:chromosomal replication initiation ATPase DnaA
VIRPDRHRRFLTTQSFAEAALTIVCTHFGADIAKVRGLQRPQSIVRVRSVAAYVLRHATTLSYPEIGVMLGGKDHSTMIVACRRVEKALLVDGVLKWDLLQIAQTLAEKQQIRLTLPSETKLLEPPTQLI